jgi:hypothetical protein
MDPLWSFTLHIFINVLHNYAAEYHKLVLLEKKVPNFGGNASVWGGEKAAVKSKKLSKRTEQNRKEKKRKRPPKDKRRKSKGY